MSPIGFQAFVSGDGLTVLASEVRWVWLPSALLMASRVVWQRAFTRLYSKLRRRTKRTR